MVLPFADGGEVAQTFDGARVELFQLCQYLVALVRDLALCLGLAQDLDALRVFAVAQQPAGAMTAVVTHVVGLITFRRRRQGCRGWIVVVVQVVAAAEIRVLRYLFAGALLSRDTDAYQHECQK